MRSVIQFFSTLLLCLFFTAPCAGNSDDDSPTYRVGIKTAEPFAFKYGDTWKGVSIDLLNQIADRVGFNYELVDTGNINGLLTATCDSQVDFSIAAISTTDERERILDFSHPYFMTTQGILTKRKARKDWPWLIKRLGLAALAFVIGLYVIGLIMSLIDKKDDIDTPWKGMWWALVTLTTTGYGKFVPSNVPGYIFAAIWMISSMFLLSLFTGYVASSMTVAKLTSAPTNLNTLYNTNTIAIEGSTGSRMLESMGIRHGTVNNIGIALEFIETGQATALVHDRAMLDYTALQSHKSNLYVWPVNRGQERYAIAFPSGSTLRESFNISVLEVIDSDAWKSTTLKYFGSE